MFLKLWVGMHIRPSSIYGYSGATTKAKAASDPHPPKQSHLKSNPKMPMFNHVFESTYK